MAIKSHVLYYNYLAGGWIGVTNCSVISGEMISAHKMHPGVDVFQYSVYDSSIYAANDGKIRLSANGSDDITPQSTCSTAGVSSGFIRWQDSGSNNVITQYLKTSTYSQGVTYQTTPKGHGRLEVALDATLSCDLHERQINNKAYYLEPHTTLIGAIDSHIPVNTNVQMVNNTSKVSGSNNPTYLWACTKGTFVNTGTNTSTLTAPVWNSGTYDEATPAGITLRATSHGLSSDYSVNTEVVTSGAAGSLPVTAPVESGHGLSITNSNGVLTFSSGTDMKLAKAISSHYVTGAAVTLSTPGLTYSNAFAIYTQRVGSPFHRNPAMVFNGNNQLLVGSQRSDPLYLGSQLGDVRTFKHEGNVSDATGYGLEIENIDGAGVLDREHLIFSIAERGIVYDGAAWISNGDNEYFIKTLSKNYNASSTPMIAVKSSNSEWVLPPFLNSTDGSNYSQVYIYRPKGSTANISFAVMVDSNSGTTLEASSDDYGLTVMSESSELVFDSRWDIPNIQEVQNVGGTFFSTGAYSNSTYDVRNGYKGATGPTSVSTSTASQALSVGEVVSVSGHLDPYNTYIAFSGTVLGPVIYNKVTDPSTGQLWGGGSHSLAVKILSNGGSQYSMRRVGDGIASSQSSARGQLNGASINPEGYVLLMRILA